jgi:predicted ATPase
MVNEVQIENFKSIHSLKLELGRLNVFIGENGCGKSNILEAIAMGSAAAKANVQNSSLLNRGVRISTPQLLRSGFNHGNSKKDIVVKFAVLQEEFRYALRNKNQPFSEWITVEQEEDVRVQLELQEELNELKMLYFKSEAASASVQAITPEAVRRLIDLEYKLANYKNLLSDRIESIKSVSALISSFNDFLIYSPENYFLRKFEEDNQALGIRGEGLFKLLTVIAEENPSQFNKIKECLRLIDWFDDFEIPKDLAFTEKRIQIKDRFLEEGLKFFDQRSANEGFLFLLFYFTLFISDYTPKYFSVDNIDNALNPKLCRKLIERLAQLSKEHNKQAILTTHNPAVLDGLNLEDDEQRLFVVYRNADGFTKVRRIFKPQMPDGVEPVRLSEMFLRGSIGGLPKNF